MATNPTPSQVSNTIAKLYRSEYHKVLTELVPSIGGHYSGQQVAYAKGVARKRMVARIEAGES
ncbi:MAG: hypothetical protein J2P16_00135 [Mycobacterium sp.]|nr:hypothetical protein [Mycobacterium sp.]